MTNDGNVNDLLKNLSIAGTGLGTGVVGSIPSAVSFGASGLKWLLDEKDPENPTSSKILDFIKNIAEKATPEKLQQYAGQATGGYLTPKTPVQKGISEFTQDIGSVIGFGGPVKTAIKLASLGNVAKQGVKLAGGTDETAETAKLVGMVTSPLFKFNKIPSLYKSLYNDARAAISPKSVTPSKNIYNAAKEVMETASKGGNVPYKNTVKRFANSIYTKINEKNIPVEELWEFKKDLNEITTRGVFASRRRAILKPLEKELRSSLDAYGNKNKEFGYALKNADTLFGIEKGLPLIDKAMNKVVGLKDSGLGEYFRKSMAWGFGGMKGLLVKKYLGSLSKRGDAFLQSPAYRKASIDLAKATAKDSLPATVNALRKLGNIYESTHKGLINKGGKTFKFISPEELPDYTTAKPKEHAFTPISSEQLAQMRSR